MGPLDDDLYPSYTDLLGSTGTFLYGRRLDEAMAVWETTPPLARSPTTRPTSRQPGKRRTKSSTREPWPRCQPQGPARTPLRPWVGPRHEGFGDTGPDRGGRTPRGTGVQGRAG